jgi:repressor LexA
MNMGERIRQRRKDLCMTQHALAELVGVERVTIARYESGTYQPAAKFLPFLAKALSCTTDYLNGLEEQISPHPDSGIKIPVFNQIPQGFTFDIGCTAGFISPADCSLCADEYFALRVMGDSMCPQVQDGDVLFIRRCDSAIDGQLALVQVNGFDATVKKIILQENGISLVSINPDYPPRFYTTQEVSALPVRILGIVDALHRDF